MAKSLEDWMNTHVKKYKEYDIRTLSNILFFREETRAIFPNRDIFFSPADGVILYQKIVNPGEPIIEIKGKNYELNHVLGSDKLVTGPALVIGIFMTFYDVHVNRIPYGGILNYKSLDAIQSNNMPMLFVEHGLFANDTKYAIRNAK